MTVINTNIKALYTQSALKISGRESQVAMEQLSTGKRINSAKDDAAGLAISSRMTQQIKSLNQAIRNAGDAISLVQTAEGATNEISNMLQRMSEMAVQASNATYSGDQRGYLDLEFQQLKQEIVRIAETHEWNGFPILNGAAGTAVGVTTVSTNLRSVASATSAINTMVDGDLKINGVAIAATPTADTVSHVATYSTKAASAISIAAAINAQTTATGGVTAVVVPASIAGTVTTVGSASAQAALYVNGEAVTLNLSADQTPAQRRQYVVDSINAGFDTHGVQASDEASGGVTLRTPDGRNLSVWYNSTNLDASDFGLGADNASDTAGVSGIAAAVATTVTASTVYGSVKLESDTAFTVEPGANAAAGATGTSADPTFARFTALGFVPGTTEAQTTGRLNFQVGASANQLISIDLADFGKNGSITGALTRDADEVIPFVNIKTVEGANAVIDKINQALDSVNGTRAVMGAVMNRLEHVIDNLTNVSMNSEASRSQIEDADYAAASTELARTQIMQQAATAILAQANTDQQTVLKLLQ